MQMRSSPWREVPESSAGIFNLLIPRFCGQIGRRIFSLASNEHPHNITNWDDISYRCGA